MNQQNIVLIGMPGAGKSTVGVLLAKTLGMSFVDTDLLIQEQKGRLLQTILDTDGVKRFLEIEAGIVRGLQVENSVIATGGSVVYHHDAVLHLKRNGLIYYLELKFNELRQRIHNMSSRGIVKEKDQQLIDIYNERIILYRKYADIIIDCSGATIEDVVTKIVNNATK